MLSDSTLSHSDSAFSKSNHLYHFKETTATRSGCWGVLDSGAQRGVTGRKSEILKRTGTSLLMQLAVGPAKYMPGILMGAETQDSHGKPFVLVVPDVSVYDLAMSDSLIPMGRLVEAGFTVNHRIPSQAKEDGFSLQTVSPL